MSSTRWLNENWMKNIFYQDNSVTLFTGDSLELLRQMDSESVQCCVTSPPYFNQRNYGIKGQLGLEATPEEYTAKIGDVFDEVKRVLKKDGTLWLNLGDSYSGSGYGIPDERSPMQASNKGTFFFERIKKAEPSLGGMGRAEALGYKPKDLFGIPWMVAFELRRRGWYLRCDIIWSKPNPMPESVQDRPTKSHEYIFLMTNSKKYFYDMDAIKEESVGEDTDRTLDRMTGSRYLLEGKNQLKAGLTLERGALKLSDKQRGHSRKHEGFNNRWDIMKKLEQQSYGRNKRSVWTIATHPFHGAHFATFPPDLVKSCILAGTRIGDTVLDPFSGSGTTALVSKKFLRKAIGLELNPKYNAMAVDRLKQEMLPFSEKTQ